MTMTKGSPNCCHWIPSLFCFRFERAWLGEALSTLLMKGSHAWESGERLGIALNKMGDGSCLEEGFLVNNAVTESVCLSSAFFNQGKHEWPQAPLECNELTSFYASRMYHLNVLVVPSLGELRK